MRASVLHKSVPSAGHPRNGPSNIRGRISGPIPIPDPVDDDEFPMRQPGTGVATPLGYEGNQRLQAPNGHDSLGVSSPVPDAATGPRPLSVAMSGPPPAPSSSYANSPTRGAEQRTSNLRYSTASAGTDAGGPHRKKSTLRTTLGKIFGRKKKTPSDGSASQTHIEEPVSSAQHRSVNANNRLRQRGSDANPRTQELPAASKALDAEPEPNRSASMPITEYDRALRSHSLGPEDMIAISSARNSLQNDSRPRLMPVASKMHTIRSRDFGDFQGLSPRPASSHARTSHVPMGDDVDDIGKAITSDIRSQHRRSRSLSQLTSIVDGQEPRNRTDEIRYWSESFNPGLASPVPSNMIDDVGATASPLNAAPESPPFESRPQTPAMVERQHDDETPPPPLPPQKQQPFNFGTMIGMKITQAASLEERIGTLERHNQKLEKLVAKLFQVVPGVEEYTDAPSAKDGTGRQGPPSTSKHTQSSSSRYAGGSSASRQSFDSFGDGQTFINSSTAVSSSLPTIPQQKRPLSNATVRATTSMPSMPRDVFTADHYTTLLALLETERVARQTLEDQVRKLNTKVVMMSRIIRPDQPPSVSSAFDHDDDDDDDDEDDTQSRDGSSEAFKTPIGEESAGFNTFGGDAGLAHLNHEEPDYSKRQAARTLSLSQLTLGKPPVPPRAARQPQPTTLTTATAAEVGL